MTMTEAVLFSTGFSWLMYLGFVELFKNEKFCILVRNDRNWRWLQPNYICTIRMVMALISYVIFFFLNWHVAGIFLFTQAAVLDGVDGLVARAIKLITEFGESYDPLCDKITYIPPILSFIGIGIIEVGSVWIALFLISEFCGQFVVRKIQERQGWSAAANMFGKVKAVLCFSLIIYAAILMDNLDIHNFAGKLFCICAVLSFVSAVTKLMPKSVYAYFILVTNLCCGAVGLYLVVYPRSDILLYIFIAVASLEITLTVSPHFQIKNMYKQGLEKTRKVFKKIPKSVLVLFAAFLFLALAFSLKIDDDVIVGTCMIIMSTFFLILGRLKIA